MISYRQEDRVVRSVKIHALLTRYSRRKLTLPEKRSSL